MQSSESSHHHAHSDTEVVGTTSLGSSVIRNPSSRILQVSQDLKSLASFTERPQEGKFDWRKSAAIHALKGLKFVSKTDGSTGWAAVEKRFDDFTYPTHGLLPRAAFGECIGMNKDKEFALKLFDGLARRRNIVSHSITKEQLKEFWDQISDENFDSRLQTFFDIFDKDADGRITEEEVTEIISLNASANKLSNIQKHAAEYAALIMKELDPNKNGYIRIGNLETLLLQASNQTVRGESRNQSQKLSQQLELTLHQNAKRRWHQDFKYFLEDNWQRIWVVALWIGVMVGLFAYKYVQYKNRAAYEVMGACVCMAKGAAETLKLNMALILLPVCRNTITWLRNKTKLGAAVPFDDNLNFHEVIACALAIGIGIHGISHLTCDFPRLLHASPVKYKKMIQFFGQQPTSYWHFVGSWEGITGIVMVILMAIAFTLASPWFRRKRIHLPKPFNKLTCFNAFWYSHHLFVIVYALLIIHGEKLYLTRKWYNKTTWMYLAVPILLYTGERLLRAFRSKQHVTILKVAIYPGNVLALHVSKPLSFNYKSGQYMFVNCAAVSPFEWHPFFITSAPWDDYLTVHIRAIGDWTRQLKTVFSEICLPPPAGISGLLLTNSSLYKIPVLLIDGPYGAPAQDYKKYEVILLVGIGMGATPMISIVKDIMNNMKAVEVEENSIENGVPQNGSPLNKRTGSRSGSGANFKTKRVYFNWVISQQGSFDWFKGIMNEVAEMDEKGVIKMHNYYTNVYEEGDARSALITMLQTLNHAKTGVDDGSGTRVKSHFAKPNWLSVYKKIALRHSDRIVGVFYRGPPALMKELKQLASYFSHRTSTKFEFQKENF